jgi:hypothetical protein
MGNPLEMASILITVCMDMAKCRNKGINHHEKCEVFFIVFFGGGSPPLSPRDGLIDVVLCYAI